MESRHFKVYRASAGSGKTYTLTYNYLRLALKSPKAFQAILAVTFTNKATEEMKSRILDTLKAIAQGQPHAMAADLMGELEIDEKELQGRADRTLRSILHQYSFFAVTTIDSFFQKIVRAFAQEIGIKSGFKVELNLTKVLTEVIDKLYAQMSKDDPLTHWLTRFALAQVHEGKRWDTRADMKTLAFELFDESVSLNKESMFKPTLRAGFVAEFMDRLQGRLSEIENAYYALGHAMAGGLQPLDLFAEDFTQKQRGVGGYIVGVAHGGFKAPNAYVIKALAEEKWYAAKAPKAQQIARALDGGLREAVQKACDYYHRHSKEYYSIRELIKRLYTFGTLAEIQQEIVNYRAENDLLLISDFPTFIYEILAEGNTPYIYEKIGAKYRHYLMDEFQDTSEMQWRNFKPLIKNVLSEGSFSMVVGDIKQSIYRWRGGNWKILLNQMGQDQALQPYLKEESLATNRRSRQNIIDFNNDFFRAAPQLLEKYFPDEFRAEIQDYLQARSAYEGSEQAYENQPPGGLIDMHIFKEEDPEDTDPSILDRLIANLKALQDAGYRLGDMAILVRKKSEAAKVTQALMAYAQLAEGAPYRFDLVSDESLYLKNNAAVHFILQALRLVHRPKEPLLLTQLTYACQHYAEHTKQSPENTTAERLTSHLESLAAMSASTLVAFVIEQYDMYQHAADHAYLMAFQDALMDYRSQASDDLAGFLAWWAEQALAIQTPDHADAIRLMTVHKSKGLQFKAVLIPFCHWGFDHSASSGQTLWCDTQAVNAAAALPYLPVRYKKDLMQTVFKEDFLTEKADIYLDHLNLLYVAFTRAEEALYVTAALKKDDRAGKINSAATLLKQYLIDTTGAKGEDDPLAAVRGTLPTHAPRPTAAPKPLAHVLPARLNPIEKSLSSVQPILALEKQKRAIRHGKVIHDVYAQSQRKEDLPLALAKAKQKFRLSADDYQAVKKKVNAIWRLPQVSDWFQPGWEVLNERAILLPDGQTMRPDRVMTKAGETVILDYKTGAKHDAHIRQVANYKAALIRMGCEGVSGYLVYLAESAEVVQV